MNDIMTGSTALAVETAALRVENERLGRGYNTARDAHDRLLAKNERLQAALRDAVMSDTEYCAELERINKALIDAPTVDIDVVVPDRDYSAMTPRDCYEAGLLDGVYQAREAIKAAARAALAALAAQPAPSPWRPIETAPKDGTRILCGRFVTNCPYDRDGTIDVDQWYEPLGGFSQFNMRFWPPTHWMPLPPAPKEEE